MPVRGPAATAGRPLSGTSVLPPSQDKTHEPTDSREHLFPQRSCCRSRVSLRVLAEQACLRRSRGHALPHLRRVERQATTRRKDTPELQRCLGALLPAGLHNSHIRPSAVRRPANARVAAVAAGRDPPAGNPGYQPPRILNSYETADVPCWCSQPASIRTFHPWLRVQRSSWPGVMPRSGVRGIGGANRVDHGRPRTLPMTSLVSETPGRCRRGPWRLVSEALARQRGVSAARRGSVD
jgi:hypothetical protein